MRLHLAGTAAVSSLVVGLLAAPALTQTAPAAPAKPTEVKAAIDSGMLVGERLEGVNMFRGVPFAKAPVGELRWKAPQRPARWGGERYAVAYEPPCSQPVNIDMKTVNGGGVAGVTSEDCLYLNVWAPAGAKNAPMVVWLYGGASYLGAAHLGSFNGTSNAKAGVITITANYRLGALGSFSHPALTKEAADKGMTGGFALMDAVAALQWAKRNAAALGGDPNNITLAGQSAGAAMVVNMLSIPSAKGLFQKAVVESGAAIGPGLSEADAEKAGVEAAAALGFKDATMAQLRQVSAQTLVANPATQKGWAAPIDGKFRTTATIDALKAGTETDVPVLIGANSGEGGFDAARTIAQYAGAKGAGAWLYHFSYIPSFRKEWTKGTIHSGEIMFAFNSLDTSSWAANAAGSANDADRTVAKKVNSCWVAFYKMDPKAKAFACADGFTWPAFNAAGDDAAEFGATPKVVKSKTIANGPPQG